MKVRLTPRAKSDLQRIGQYISQESPAGAKRILTRIRKRIQDLSRFPWQGEQSHVNELRQLFVSRTNYFIVYRVNDAEVQVITIIHSSQNHRS